jgi:hypothetical protein
MANVYVHTSGTFTAAKEIFVKDAGTWQTVKEVWIKDGGVWVQAFPESTGTQSYTTAGSYSWTVPNGIYSISATIVGGGGGGGGFYGSGDTHAGGGGGSGGYYSGEAVAVTPGETLTIVVGAGGGSASFEFNGSFICTGTAYGTSGTYWNGKPGESTIIYRGATPILTATGGGQGLGAGPGDNYGASAPGAGGLPNGVTGTAGQTQRNSYPPAPGGDNGTGYGAGGQGNGSSGQCPGVGGTGYASLSW